MTANAPRFAHTHSNGFKKHSARRRITAGQKTKPDNTARQNVLILVHMCGLVGFPWTKIQGG